MIVISFLYLMAIIDSFRPTILTWIECISDHPFLSAILFTLLTWFLLVFINLSMLAFAMFPWYMVILGMIGFVAITIVVAYAFDRYIKGGL